MQGINFMKKYALLLCIALGLITCSNNQPTVTETATVVPTILWKTSSRDAIPEGVDSVRITISSSSLSSSMVKIFSYNDNQGTIPSVPAEISITITVEGIDSLGRVLYSGSVVVARVTAPTMDITIEASQVTPIAPSDLVAQTLSYKSIRLIWKENSTNETYYLISRQISGAATWDSVGTTAQNTFTDSTLAPVTQYLYRVIAANAAGRSAATASAAATTLIMDKIGPVITISSFKKIDTVNTFTVTLYGTAHDTSKIYQVMINDIVAQLSGDQWIKQNYYLSDTVNTIVIRATDNSPFKNVTLDTLTLIYKTTYIDTTNHAPVFTVTGDSMKATVKVGRIYKKALSGFDVDANDTIRFVVSTPLALLGKDTVIWRPHAADIGSMPCYALVYDKKQAYDSIAWTMTVIDSATPIPNHTPVFVTKASDIRDSMSQNKQYRDTLVASDEDAGQKLTFSILTGPSGLIIGDASGIITWTAADTGTFAVTARVMDDSGAYADIGWRIRIIPASVKVNNPPTFVTRTMDMTGTATVGVLYKDTVTATDPDSGAVLRFSVVNGPVRIDQTTGIVTWSPPTKGNYSMTVRVTDEAGASVDLSWPMTVSATSNGLVAWYPFNGNANDASGNGNNGTVNGATLTSDRFTIAARAYNFNGTSNWIDCGTNASLQVGNALTVEAWVNFRSFPTFNGIKSSYIISRQTNETTPGFFGLFVLDQKPVFRLAQDVDNIVHSGLPSVILDVNKWYHLAGTWDGDSMRLFVNGLKINTAIGPKSPISSNSGSVQIGRLRDISFQYYVDGSIDDIHIYNHALSAAEIDSLYHVGGWTGVQNTPAGMKLIPAKDSSFQMGQVGLAEPLHKVTFTKDFFMDSTEVTQANYQALMGVNPSYATGNLNRPVENVSWFDAVLYCNKRSIKEGLDSVYKYTSIYGTAGDGCSLSNVNADIGKNGYRLPTEAEWEYACRAGTTTQYYWNNGIAGDYAWYSINSNGKSYPIAQKLSNAFKLYDMCGNVFEWCNDWYGTYNSIAQSDPTGPQTGTNRVIRGGSWNNTVNYLLSANRQNSGAFRSGDGGFRCVYR
jgi:formylglycine-generating enzyme required for sulfatase activity